MRAPTPRPPRSFGSPRRIPRVRTLPAALLPAVVLVSCGGPEPLPVVDVAPLGEALRFLAVALVLAAIIRGVLSIWGDRD